MYLLVILLILKNGKIHVPIVPSQYTKLTPHYMSISSYLFFCNTNKPLEIGNFKGEI